MGYVLTLMIFLPLVGAVVALALGSGRAALVRWVALATTLATLLFAIIVVANFTPRASDAVVSAAMTNKGPIQPQMEEVKIPWLTFDSQGNGIQFYLGIDGISLWLVALTALLMVPSVLVSWESITDRVAEYYALLLLLEMGMLGVFCAFDIILFYVFFEFTLIPLFFLIGMWGGPQKRYAARKFFIYTLAGSLIGLVGLVALVLSVHADGSALSFSIPELARNLAQRPLDHDVQHWIFLALFAAFAIKVPLPPFHTWLPLAHVEAPTAGSVLLAGVLLKLGTYGFLRFCLPMLPDATVSVGVPLVALLSVIGIIYGALCALAQDDIKKLVAYSSVSHLGFCMLGMFALNGPGITGSVLQMVNHGLSTGGLFLLVGMMYERYHTRQLSELGGLANRLPLLASCMVFIALSSVGLPGLNGFTGEVLTLMGMFKAHPWYAVFGTTGVILGAWYLFTMLQRGFFGPLKEPHHLEEPIVDLKPREWAALIPIIIMCIWIGFYPNYFTNQMKPDVDALVQIYQKK